MSTSQPEPPPKQAYIESVASSISSSESSTGADKVALSSRPVFFFFLVNSMSSSLLRPEGIEIGAPLAKSRLDRFGRCGKSKRGMVLLMVLLLPASSVAMSKEDCAGKYSSSLSESLPTETFRLVSMSFD